MMMHGFGERLRECRKNKGWTQLQLALRCNLNTENIGWYEREKNYPSLQTAAILSNVLGVTIDYLVKGEKP